MHARARRRRGQKGEGEDEQEEPGRGGGKRRTRRRRGKRRRIRRVIGVDNMHCIGPAGPLVFVDQGYTFRRHIREPWLDLKPWFDPAPGEFKSMGLPFVDEWVAAGGGGAGASVTASTGAASATRRRRRGGARRVFGAEPMPLGYHGLCVGASTRRAVMALGEGGAFGRQFAAAARAVEEGVLDDMLLHQHPGNSAGEAEGGAGDGTAAAAEAETPAPALAAVDEHRRQCGFGAEVVRCVAARFEHALRQVEGCVQSEAGLAEWYAALDEKSVEEGGD
jgi:hypothetical protein